MELIGRRLAAQQIARPGLARPAEVVAWLGAVQAQDYLAALWAIGLRLRGRVGEDEVERALVAGEIVRTHALRGTWQLVAPADLRWLLALIGPRVIAAAAGRHRELGLGAADFRRAERALGRALAG